MKHGINGFWVKGRQFMPILAGFLLFAFGAIALSRLLSPIQGADIVAQIGATPSFALALSLGATVVAYVALIGYDWWGLKFIGKNLPGDVILLLLDRPGEGKSQAYQQRAFLRRLLARWREGR